MLCPGLTITKYDQLYVDSPKQRQEPESESEHQYHIKLPGIEFRSKERESEYGFCEESIT